MNSPYQFGKSTGAPIDQRIVYVRPLEVSELPSHIQAQVPGLSKVFGVFRPNGEQIALTVERSMAFDLARKNALTPLSVH